MKAKWTVSDIPDLSNKVAIVTGANIGLGLEIATQLAANNARVYLACRTPSKAESAKASILQKHPSALIETPALDLSSFDSVHSFAREFLAQHTRLDILMCNAGVMGFQERRQSTDGHELQFATNHLGHFLLTTLLQPLLKNTEDSRLVTQSSAAHLMGKFDFDDLDAIKKYDPWGQYGMTKLSNVAFANEYNRRVNKKKEEEGNGGDDSGNVKAFSVHPGVIVGQLQNVQAEDNKFYHTLYWVFGLFAGTYETGALPALYACTAPEASVGEFYGPHGWWGNMSFRGNHPAAVKVNKIALDETQTAKLWDISEEMTGCKFDV